MPQMAKNATAPMITHIAMLFIMHLRFLFDREDHPPDAAHYALSPFLCLLEIQRKLNSTSITPHTLSIPSLELSSPYMPRSLLSLWHQRNKIKVIKRMAFGFHDFEYFRLKILSVTGYLRPYPRVLAS